MCDRIWGNRRGEANILAALKGPLLLPSIQCFAQFLVQCRVRRVGLHASQLYAFMHKNGLDSHRILGNYLVPLLVEVGNMHDARYVFDTLTYHNDWSYCSIITGYVKGRKPQLALALYQQADKDDLTSISGHTFLSLLKACLALNDVKTVVEIHSKVVSLGFLEQDLFLGNALVDIYAKSGLLSDSQEVFDGLPIRDVVTWTTLVAGYTEYRFYSEALQCFEQMKLEGVSPDSVTYICVLAICSGTGNIEQTKHVHAEIEGKGLLQTDLVLGNTLLNTYAKIMLLSGAQCMFDCLPTQDVVSWTALITGYAECGHRKEALVCFEEMHHKGFPPDGIIYVCVINICGDMEAVEKGLEIHAKIENTSLENDNAIGNALVDMYGKFGMLGKATEIFDKLVDRDVVSWTVRITGYVWNGCEEEALDCFDQMQHEGVSPNSMTYACSLNACGCIKAVSKGQEIHAEVERMGLLEKDITIAICLIDMYSKCGYVARAQYIFDKLCIRTVVLWTTLISAYAEHGRHAEAIRFFGQMQRERILPNVITLVCILKAFSGLGAANEIEKLHIDIEKKGWVGENLIVGNTLVGAYAKCGLLKNAQHLFDRLPARDVATWNSLISGFLAHGHGQAALELFEHMRFEGISLNNTTFMYALKACGNAASARESQEFCCEIERTGSVDSDTVLGKTLVVMYVRFGWFQRALEIFESLKIRDVVLWNALIAGYTQHEDWNGALKWFEEMEVEAVPPDTVTLICCLQACGGLGASDKGQQVHVLIERKGLLKGDIMLSNAVIYMYVKCNMLVSAQKILCKLPSRDVVSWSTIIAGYGQNGDYNNVFHIYKKMLDDGVKPDLVTFSLLLNACSLTGLSDKSQNYFEAMSKDYAIVPTLEHHNSLIDLLCRRGKLDDAIIMLNKMPFSPDLVGWHTVLAACRNCGNIALANKAFKHLTQTEGNNSAARQHMC